MMNLGQFRRRFPKLTDLLPWSIFLDDGLILNKDGSFQVTYRFRGPDRQSATDRELMAYRVLLNHALKILGTRWGVFTEAQRWPVRGYPQSTFTEGVTRLIDDQRRGTFQALGAGYETTQYITFVYLPPSEHIGRAQRLFVKSNTDKKTTSYRRELAYFKDQVRSVIGVMRGVMPLVEPLDTAATLTYLHSCVSIRRVSMLAPDVPTDIDTLVSDCPLVGGLSLKLGDQHLKAVSIRAYPGRTVPALLDAVHHLPLSCRWVVRWLPLSPPDARKLIQKVRRHWDAQRRTMTSYVKEALFKQEQTRDDPDAVAKVQDADAALEVLGDGALSYGYLTLTVIVFGDSEAQATEHAKKVQEVVDSQGLASSIETFNSLEAFLSSVPGQVYANVRGPVMMSLNLCDLIPAHSVWSGPQWCDHLNGPALLRCTTGGSTPFYFCNFFQDIGHVIIVGMTGSGKTTLLNLMVAQFRRYPNSQVFIFDYAGGCRALTLAVGGDFYDLAAWLGPKGRDNKRADDNRLAFAPLAGVDQESERRWAQQWLLGILELEGVKTNPQLKTAVWKALENLATRSDPRQRTMSVFVGVLQHARAKEALKLYTLEGPYGGLFDADRENLRDGDWQAFETEGLSKNKTLATIVLMYLFHRLEQRFESGRPTMLVLDEAWVVLLDATFAAMFMQWLKVLRKKNVSVVFATQSLDDVARSPVAATVIESCPTKVFLANPQAIQPQAKRLYEGFGLNEKQIQIIANATPKREYYFHSPEGCRLFELGLTDVELAFLAAGSAADQKLIDRVLAKHGRKDFARHWLRAKGLHETVDHLGATNTHEGDPNDGSST